MSAPKWSVGMEKLAPGVYAGKDGEMHLDPVELCESAGFEPSEANCRMLETAARAMFKRTDTKVIFVEDESKRKNPS